MKRDILSEPIILFDPVGVYTLQEISDRLQVSSYIMRAARLSGALPTINLGGPGRGADYRVIGADANQWVTTLRGRFANRGDGRK